MFIRNRVVALLFRIIVFLGCLCGLYLTSGLAQGAFKPSLFAYYTIQSNLLVLVLFAVLIVRTAANPRTRAVQPHLKGAVTMAITVTLLVYHFVLVPQLFAMSTEYHLFSLQDTLVHYFVPLATIADWLLFDPKGSYRWFDPLAWLVIPILYFCFAMLRAHLLGPTVTEDLRYPYFFLNLDELGWSGVLSNAAWMTACFAVLGYVIYGIDSLLGKVGAKRAQS